jgi:uncharacterized alpha-E superfamily protein
MLSRTADHLYWMSRYIERAESLARLVDAHYRMSLLPHSGDTLAQSLSATMTALHMEQAYREHHETIEPRAVFEFVSLDREYSGSIFSCLRAARENARAVRGSLTSELWETLNSTWLEARTLVARGTFLERADSTARILTAHQIDLKPGADAGEVPDPFEWSVLLRALSAFEVYRRVYRDVITPLKVAQLLILRDDMPRSLLRCCKEVYQNLKSVANEQSAETERRAGEMHAMLHFTRMEDILAQGLPEFLEQFLAKARNLGDRIASDFLVPPAEA